MKKITLLKITFLCLAWYTTLRITVNIKQKKFFQLTFSVVFACITFVGFQQLMMAMPGAAINSWEFKDPPKSWITQTTPIHIVASFSDTKGVNVKPDTVKFVLTPKDSVAITQTATTEQVDDKTIWVTAEIDPKILKQGSHAFKFSMSYSTSETTAQLIATTSPTISILFDSEKPVINPILSPLSGTLWRDKVTIQWNVEDASSGMSRTEISFIDLSKPNAEPQFITSTPSLEFTWDLSPTIKNGSILTNSQIKLHFRFFDIAGNSIITQTGVFTVNFPSTNNKIFMPLVVLGIDNNNYLNAKLIIAPSTITDTLVDASNNRWDYYKVNLEASIPYTLELRSTANSPSSSDLDLYLYQLEGTSLKEVKKSDTKGINEKIHITPTVKSDYYILVYGYAMEKATEYQLEIKK